MEGKVRIHIAKDSLLEKLPRSICDTALAYFLKDIGEQTCRAQIQCQDHCSIKATPELGTLIMFAFVAFSQLVDILLLICPSCVLDMDVLGQAWSAHGWHLHEVTCQRRANASVVLTDGAFGLAVVASHMYMMILLW